MDSACRQFRIVFFISSERKKNNTETETTCQFCATCLMSASTKHGPRCWGVELFIELHQMLKFTGFGSWRRRIRMGCGWHVQLAELFYGNHLMLFARAKSYLKTSSPRTQSKSSSCTIKIVRNVPRL